jgi:hypothetical protein
MTALEKQMREFAELLYRHYLLSEQAGIIRQRPPLPGSTTGQAPTRWRSAAG